MASSFHGGAFWEAIGPSFDSLETRDRIINADVLDAWFPPAPAVIEALAAHVPFGAMTSPPTHSEGLVQAIAEARGLKREQILVGPGSSNLMFAAFRSWVKPSSRVLLIEPTYGEYAHLCESVVGCETDRLVLDSDADFAFDPDAWIDRVQAFRPHLAILVNPNNPTGRSIDVAALLAKLPRETRLLVDEAYIDYSASPSVERLVTSHPNLVVLKSLSKAHALSGMRVAYLVATPEMVAELSVWSPPWSVSLPAQMAAVAALRETAYYAQRVQETHTLRESFGGSLASLGLRVFPAEGNWVLVQLPPSLSSHEVVSKLSGQGIYVRDAGRTAPSLGSRFVRLAVKEEHQQRAIVEALRQLTLRHDSVS